MGMDLKGVKLIERYPGYQTRKIQGPSSMTHMRPMTASLSGQVFASCTSLAGFIILPYTQLFHILHTTQLAIPTDPSHLTDYSTITMAYIGLSYETAKWIAPARYVFYSLTPYTGNHS